MSQKLAPITCDGCGKDITDTTNCDDYRLALIAQRKMPWYVRELQSSGFVTSMAVEPDIDHPRHFCGLRCLAEWCQRDFKDFVVGTAGPSDR